MRPSRPTQVKETNTRSFSLLLLLALLPWLSGCTSDQLDLSRDAEMAYADLLIALHRGEATAAREAAAARDIVIRDMRGGWPRPLNMHAVWELAELFGAATIRL